jgi:hypothetical protein
LVIGFLQPRIVGHVLEGPADPCRVGVQLAERVVEQRVDVVGQRLLVDLDGAGFAWDLAGPDGSVIVTGLDLGKLAADGRFRRISGFFGELPDLVDLPDLPDLPGPAS